MKKLVVILGLFFSSALFANEPSFSGAFFSDYPGGVSDKNWIGTMGNKAFSAGNLYLYQNKISSINYITNQKSSTLTQAIEEAKKFAISHGKNFYAVTNLAFQIIQTENTVELYSDYYILAW